MESLGLMMSLVSVAHAALPRLVTEFAVPNAAVCNVGSTWGASGPSLTIATFSPSATDGVFVVRDVAQLLSPDATVTVELVENATQWPNQAEVTGDGNHILTACGFFVSSAKSTGSIDVFDISKYPEVGHVKVSEDREANFYHHAEYMDVDHDGTLDIVAARSFKSMNPLSTPEGELLWFKPPTGAGRWETRYLTTPQGHDGPDVGFTTADLDGDGRTQFIASQFFTQQALTVWECRSGKWSDCENGVTVASYTIDNIKTPFFNVQWIDLNMDGKKDILATTNTADGSGAVYAYELKGEFRDGPKAWIKHTLATGYKPISPLFPPGQGSPGTAVGFSLSANSTEKPLIMVSADDGGWVDILYPASRDASDWTYSQERLVNSTGTVGTPSVPTVIDAKGTMAFFVPLYAESKVAMYAFE